jgi:cation transport ATPase
VAEEDWSTQLKKIERQFEGLPPEPSPAFKKLQSEEERRAKERAQQRSAMFGATARLVLVFALFAALFFWPYANACGTGLFSYVGVEAVIVAGGIWVAITTWRSRLPRLHAVSLLVILAGITLIAAEILPRTGYAAIDPRHPPQIWCPTEASVPPTTVLTQDAHYAGAELGDRWRESSTELAKQLLPQRAALVRLERPELLSQKSP